MRHDIISHCVPTIELNGAIESGRSQKKLACSSQWTSKMLNCTLTQSQFKERYWRVIKIWMEKSTLDAREEEKKRREVFCFSVNQNWLFNADWLNCECEIISWYEITYAELSSSLSPLLSTPLLSIVLMLVSDIIILSFSLSLSVSVEQTTVNCNHKVKWIQYIPLEQVPLIHKPSLLFSHLTLFASCFAMF
jgi:hypothetical protein